VRIFTGAPIPAGCDTVVMQEDCAVADAAVVIPAGVRAGANRRRAGEDVRAGTRVLHRGRRLRPWDLALAAACGRPRLRVFRRLRVAVFSTGDELRPPEAPLAPGEIHDANRFGLIALLDDFGCQVTDLGIVEDHPAALHNALTAAAAGHDLIVTSGGMSVGEEDHVKAVVTGLGRLHLWQLAIKPGRPIGFGDVAGVPFLGLPGNPVAMVVVMLRIARPMILRLAGCADTDVRGFRVAADFSFTKKAGRREWLRASLADDDGGRAVLRRFPREGSGILTSLVDSDGLIELGEEVTRVEPGTPVDFFPFSSFR
jgi:molybdopterin molybdotransferase